MSDDTMTRARAARLLTASRVHAQWFITRVRVKGGGISLLPASLAVTTVGRSVCLCIWTIDDVCGGIAVD